MTKENPMTLPKKMWENWSKKDLNSNNLLQALNKSLNKHLTEVLYRIGKELQIKSWRSAQNQKELTGSLNR